MIKHKKIQFTVSVAMRDIQMFSNKEKIEFEIKHELSTHLTNLYPLQMIVDSDGEVEITEKENK